MIYSILLTFFLYRTMTWDHFMQAAAKASKTTGVVLLLIGVSTMFQYLMGLYSVADLAGEAMASISDNPWVVFFLINLILFLGSWKFCVDDRGCLLFRFWRQA